MDGRHQLHTEIQRHEALARLTHGAIRQGHLDAAACLAALLAEIGGDRPSKSKRGGRSPGRRRVLSVKRAAQSEAKICRGK